LQLSCSCGDINFADIEGRKLSGWLGGKAGDDFRPFGATTIGLSAVWVGPDFRKEIQSPQENYNRLFGCGRKSGLHAVVPQVPRNPLSNPFYESKAFGLEEHANASLLRSVNNQNGLCMETQKKKPQIKKKST